MKTILSGLVFLLILSCKPQQVATTDCKENLKEDCICTMQYDPVCGCNGKTYGNACVANCSGITDYQPGECE